jgi:hypothetical protein
MPSYVFDVEWCVAEGADIVLDAEYIHCAVFKELNKSSYDVFSSRAGDNPIADIKDFLRQDNLTLIGHNILSADLEVFRRLLGIDFTVGPDTLMHKKCCFIDTLTMSCRNNPDRKPAYYHDVLSGKNVSLGIHGLDAWGKRVGIAKPKVTDWSTQDISVYIERCQEDVKINELTYYKLLEERA